MSEEAKWYVVHTYSGYENKVAKDIEQVVENRKLQDLIPEVRVPTELVTEVKENKRSGKQETKEVEKKLFPSYVLVKMVLTDDSWYIVRNTRGVTGFVPLTEREVKALGVETKRSENITVSFKVGDNVEVTGGSFEGFIGKVEKIDLEAQTADVLVSMFGRETSVTLPLTQVKPEA